MPAEIPIPMRGTIRTEPRQYGTSTYGTPLLAWGPGKAERPLLIAGVHGEETNSTVTASRALRSIPAADLEATVILCANPDGLTRGTRGNARGVDLNRNFPSSDWTSGPVHHRWHGKGERIVELTSGAAPASEVEVATLISFIQRLEPSVILDIHSPLSAVIDLEDSPLGRRLASDTGLRYSHIDTLSRTGMAGTYFKEVGIPYLNLELPDESVFTASRQIVPVLSRYLTCDLS